MADICAFHPLFPEERVLGEVQELAGSLVCAARELASPAHFGIRAALATPLRAMNSYYTNRIEGQHTLPADLERALRHDFDADAALGRKQRLALAHMEAEASLEAELADGDPRALFAPQRVSSIHAELYRRLPPEDRITDEGEPIEPGAWRSRDVVVGRHVCPRATDIPSYMEAWRNGYATQPGNERLVIAIACSHQRLAWIHPFIDGNGRAARLHSHLTLHAMGLTGNLWSPLRGMARQHEAYYARLHNADLPRRNDVDGRGALSQEELIAFAKWFLEMCLDQVAFMRGMLALDGFRGRMADALRQLEAHPWSVGTEKSVIKQEALRPLHYVSLAGPLERSEFLRMLGLPERTARRVLASLLDYGLLTSDSRLGPVSFAVPFRALRWLFPRLWPEADETLAR
jgi:Fic family protein